MAFYITSPSPQGLNGWYGISGLGPASRIIAGVYALAGNGREWPVQAISIRMRAAATCMT